MEANAGTVAPARERELSRARFPAAGVVVRPPVVAAPMIESQVYLAPGTTYVQPGTEWEDRPIIIEGRRSYRDCWWDWGRRRCELKPWW